MRNVFPSCVETAGLFNLAGSHSGEMHLCGLRALPRSIPRAFHVLSSGKAGGKGIGVLF